MSFKKKAFTLVELLIVLSVISLLVAALITPLFNSQKSARDGRRKTDLEQIRSALEMYRSNNSAYPVYGGGNCRNVPNLVSQGYIAQIPTDPKPNWYYYCLTAANDYQVKAALEKNSTNCGTNQCGTSINCTYSLGPLGQVCPP